MDLHKRKHKMCLFKYMFIYHLYSGSTIFFPRLYVDFFQGNDLEETTQSEDFFKDWEPWRPWEKLQLL